MQEMTAAARSKLTELSALTPGRSLVTSWSWRSGTEGNLIPERGGGAVTFPPPSKR